MKKLSLFSTALMCGASVFAQSYISAAPEGGFDVNGGKDYVVLYAPEDIMTKMGSKLVSDQNLDQDQVRNYIMYWVTDWDPKDLTLYNVPEEGVKNSFGGDSYVNATPLYAWGTGAFTAKGTPYDLSKVTDEHYLHIGLRDFGSAPSKYQFTVGPNESIRTNGFQIEVGSAKGASNGDFVGVGEMPNGNDGKWYYLDIPLKDLIDENGDFGFAYDFSKPFGAEESAFTFSFFEPTCTTATKSGPAPGESVYDYEVTKLGSALSLDHVFFYIPDGSAVDCIFDSEDAGATVYYDLQGHRVENPTNGIYIAKTINGVRKVVK